MSVGTKPPIADRAAFLKLYEPPTEIEGTGGEARWMISGHPATLVIWTPEEWARLKVRPADAQSTSNGFWAALRIG